MYVFSLYRSFRIHQITYTVLNKISYNIFVSFSYYSFRQIRFKQKNYIHPLIIYIKPESLGTLYTSTKVYNVFTNVSHII